METIEIEGCLDEQLRGRRPSSLKELSVREVVCAVETVTHTIHTRAPNQESQHAWAYDSKTIFLRCSEPIAAEDLLPGDMITILSEKRGALLVAKSIRVHLPALHLFPQRLARISQKKAA